MMRYAALREVNLNTEVQKPSLAAVLEFKGATMECATESTPHEEASIYTSVLEGGNMMQKFENSKALYGRFRASCLERSDLTSGLLRPTMFWSSQKPLQQPCARIKSLVWLGNACIGLLSSDAYMFAQSKSESWHTRQASPSLCLALSPYLRIRPSLCLTRKTVDNSTSWVASLSKPSGELLGQSGLHPRAGLMQQLGE